MNRLVAVRLAAGAAVALLAVTPLASARAAGPACDGRPATITASSGDVVGTPGDDVVVASDAVRSISTGAGDDVICVEGHGGLLSVDAGPGDDLVDSSQRVHQADDLEVTLGLGSDTFVGDDGGDDVFSGAGGDLDTPTVSQAGDDDTITTGGGSDNLYVSSPTVSVSSGGGGDTVTMETGMLAGGSLRLGRGPRDKVYVGSQATSMKVDLPRRTLDIGRAHYPLVGDEYATVTATRARLVGDRHVNHLFATACDTRLVGGPGADILIQGHGSPAELSQLGCHGVLAREYGGPGNDSLTGSQGRALLYGGSGRDRRVPYAGRGVCVSGVEHGCGR